jgi:glycosyltransferase involved in cell wall biosynthesis
VISVVVPAHNEEKLVGPCVESIVRAARHAQLNQEEVLVLVVLDHCTDSTGPIAEACGATTFAVSARNVGHARAAGAQAAIEGGARWLAFTDCDSVVAPDWLVTQLALGAQGADAVCGTVCVGDWAGYGSNMQRHFAATYFDVDDHRHVHGANLGVSAAAYRRVGGFQHLPCGEDVALVQALQDAGAVVAWSAAPRVSTSARTDFRAPRGFGATLQRIEQEGAWVLPMAA